MDGILVNGQRPFSRKITNFMRAAQRLRAILRAVGRFSPLASPCRGVFVAAAALWRPMRPRALATVGSRRRERPPGWCAAGSVQKKTGDFSEKTRENGRKVPSFFRKAPNARRAVGRTRLAPSCFVAIGREPCVRKRGVPPAVCLCRRLRCGEIAVLRCGESESPLVRFDAKA